MKIALMILIAFTLSLLASLGLTVLGAPAWLCYPAGFLIGYYVASWNCWWD